MDLQVLISTMYQQGFDLIHKMNIQSDAIVINQCNENSLEFIENPGVNWINSTDRGLSRSRNKALNNATADICILADDDLEYLSNYKDIILKQFELYPDADIIAFQVEGIEAKFKSYYSKPRKIDFLTAMKISSVEIAFRLDKVKEAKVNFNESFGSGAKYYMGEESIFLSDSLKKGLNIMYVPIKIAKLHIGNSSWFNGYNKDYFINKGAAFTAISQKYSLILILQFAFRKAKLFNHNFNRYQAIKLMLEGRRRFLTDKSAAKNYGEI